MPQKSLNDDRFKLFDNATGEIRDFYQARRNNKNNTRGAKMILSNYFDNMIDVLSKKEYKLVRDFYSIKNINEFNILKKTFSELTKEMTYSQRSKFKKKLLDDKIIYEENNHIMLSPLIFQPRKNDDFIADNIRVIQNIFVMRTEPQQTWPKWSCSNMLFYDHISEYIFEYKVLSSLENYDTMKLFTTTDGLTNYSEYIESDLWKAKRKQRMDIDNETCQECGSMATEVHHTTYQNLGNESMDQLKSLCSYCHYIEHKQKETQK